MKILSVYDKEFAAYGHVITGYDLTELLETLDRISPLPAGTEYVPSNEVLEALPVAKLFAVNEYGGMPIQLGWCNGHNTKLNCLEYHRDSEVNLGTKDFILLLAKIDDIEDGKLDLVMIRSVQRWQIPFYLPGLMLSKDLKFRITKHFRASDILIEGNSLRINVDGDISPMNSVEFRINPGSLMLIR